MSLIIAMKANDGIVLSSDSRGTIGDPRGLTAINDTHRKIFKLGKYGIGIAGASEMGAVLLDEIQKTDIATDPNIDSFVQGIAQISVNCFTNWFRDIRPNERPPLLFTLAGYRANGSNPPEAMIYLLNSQMNFAPQLFTNMPCLSGVPQYAVYLMHRYYDQTISLERAKALSLYLIAETASQDPKVGGPVKIAEITAENGFIEISDEEIARIKERNKLVNEKLRHYFLEEIANGTDN